MAKKVVQLSGEIEETIYTHDASGNVMAVYDYSDDGIDATCFLKESHIYGGKRLGMYHRAVDMEASYTPSSTETRILGERDYELSNHLNNVLNVISDRLLTVDGNSDTYVDYYSADVTSWCDYTPYGMTMPGRNATNANYRYSFNGKEKIDEVSGGGNSIDFGARIYDCRVGVWHSIDPIIKSNESPYTGHSNNPVWFKDIGGADTVIAIRYSYEEHNGITLKVYNYYKIEETSEAGSKLVFQIYEPGATTPTLVTGWQSATNPNGLDKNSGVGATLSKIGTYYNKSGQAFEGEMYKYINTTTKAKYYCDPNATSVPINGYGFSFDLEFEFKPDKVNLTQSDLEDYNTAMTELDNVATLLNSPLILTNPLSGSNVRLNPANATITVTGYHSPEPSTYTPPTGTPAADAGATGNTALDMNRAASVAKFITSNTAATKVHSRSGGEGTRRTTVTVSF
ncbi:MAG: hypothetical protein IPM74_01270 [Crocinitomicaceae bacterium]|nr:hypothetical protein [Crocinitomicaceae bacterium]MBK8924547.1 hypothetical protein [Crocinitomicaceae bacterium]